MLRLALLFAVLAISAALMTGADARNVFGAFETAFDAGKGVVAHAPYTFAGVLLLVACAWMVLSPRR